MIDERDATIAAAREFIESHQRMHEITGGVYKPNMSELCANFHLAQQSEAVRAAAKLIPTNWLDSLLTGPDAALKNGDFDCRQIEALLRGIQDRIRKYADELEAANEG